jgi:hypothetical protein
MTTVMERIIAPLHGLAERSARREAQRLADDLDEAIRLQEVHEAYAREIMAEYQDVERIDLRRHDDLTISELRFAEIPAIEYVRDAGEVRIHHLLKRDLLDRAALLRALALPLDGAGLATEGPIADVKPTVVAPIERGTITLGPADVLRNAEGSRWRFLVDLSYDQVEGSRRGGIVVCKVMLDGTL